MAGPDSDLSLSYAGLLCTGRMGPLAKLHHSEGLPGVTLAYFCGPHRNIQHRLIPWRVSPGALKLQLPWPKVSPQDKIGCILTGAVMLYSEFQFHIWEMAKSSLPNLTSTQPVLYSRNCPL